MCSYVLLDRVQHKLSRRYSPQYRRIFFSAKGIVVKGIVTNGIVTKGAEG